jgi:hypothetical protein
LTRYVLVDSARTLEAMQQESRGAPKNDLKLIATTSSGMLACELAGSPYTRIDHFSSRHEIVELGWNNYAELDRFCEYFDHQAQKASPELRKRGITPFKFGYYDLKILTDTISVKILLLENLIVKAGSKDIYYPIENSEVPFLGDRLRPREESNIFSLLLQTVFRDRPQLRGVCISRASSRSLLKRAISGAEKSARLVVRSYRQFRKRHAYKGSRQFLLFDAGHDINCILPELSRNGYMPIYPEYIEAPAAVQVKEECRFLWQSLCDEPGFKQFFSRGSYSFFDLAESALSNYIVHTAPAAIAAYDQMASSLDRYRPDFSLTGTVNLGLIQRCRMLAGQHAGAPLITYTEGAGYGSIISPIYDHTEAVDGDAMLCYGDGNVEYYKDLGRQFKRFVPVGSALQEEICLRKSTNKSGGPVSRIMYVGAIVHDNINHIPNCGYISTGYYATQLKMLRMLSRLPETIKAIVKPNPSDTVLTKTFALPEFERLHLEIKPFTCVLGDADLFIIDYPSTVLLSAIGTSANVFVLVEEGVSGLTHKQKARLEKRAYLFDTFESLEEAVQQLTENPDRFPAKKNSEYMFAYSLYSNEGSAAERAYRAIRQIVTPQQLAE